MSDPTGLRMGRPALMMPKDGSRKDHMARSAEAHLESLMSILAM
jgi:hypothetical protein